MSDASIRRAPCNLARVRLRCRPDVIGPEHLQDPMRTNSDAARFHLSKGTIWLYDVRSGKRLWEKDVQGKAPAGTRVSIENDLIVYTLWGEIEKSGFLPPQQP